MKTSSVLLFTCRVLKVSYSRPLNKCCSWFAFGRSSSVASTREAIKWGWSVEVSRWRGDWRWNFTGVVPSGFKFGLWSVVVWLLSSWTSDSDEVFVLWCCHLGQEVQMRFLWFGVVILNRRFRWGSALLHKLCVLACSVRSKISG